MKTVTPMKIFPESGWSELRDRLKEQEGTVLLLGATNSGKSTLAKYLLNALLPDNIPLSLVDSDIGQSSLGLPGTICMKIFRNIDALHNYKPDKVFFIGTLNPARKVSSMIEGTKKVVESARNESAKTIVVDTTGLISGEIGIALKIGKIKAINPLHIVALQRKDELEHILSLLGERKIYSLFPSPYVRVRTRESRIQYRKEKFEEYFKDSFLYETPCKNLELYYNEKPFDLKEQYIKQSALVGLNNNGDTLALGYIDRILSDRVAIITPLKTLKDINRIVIGDIILDQI